MKKSIEKILGWKIWAFEKKLRLFPIIQILNFPAFLKEMDSKQNFSKLEICTFLQIVTKLITWWKKKFIQKCQQTPIFQKIPRFTEKLSTQVTCFITTLDPGVKLSKLISD